MTLRRIPQEKNVFNGDSSRREVTRCKGVRHGYYRYQDHYGKLTIYPDFKVSINHIVAILCCGQPHLPIIDYLNINIVKREKETEGEGIILGRSIVINYTNKL